MTATKVQALDGYKIKVMFSDGVSGIVSLADFVEKGIFVRLKDPALFASVHTDGAAIIWTDELEIDADNIYAEILNAEPVKVLHTPAFNAAD